MQTGFNLDTFSVTDMTECGAQLRQIATGAACMEEAAEHIVRFLYDHLKDTDGKSACALVRSPSPTEKSVREIGLLRSVSWAKQARRKTPAAWCCWGPMENEKNGSGGLAPRVIAPSR